MRAVFLSIFIATSYLALGTTYYIDPSGSNSSNGGIGDPWKTLSYACSRVTNSGDIIHVNAGVYTETARCNLAAGVGIEGIGDASHIISNYKALNCSDGSINLTSVFEGTIGNQSISYIKLDGGSLVGNVAIVVYRRKNVKIHHCTIVDFHYSGVTFQGGSDGKYPTLYATGNEFYNNTIINCSALNSDGFYTGLLRLGGQDGMLVYNNIFKQDSRAIGTNGNNLSSRWIKGLKFYNNKSYRAEVEVTIPAWDFHWEAFDGLGGNEIYNNEFNGCGQQIDISGWWTSKGSSDYSYWIHDNLFKLNEKLIHGGDNFRISMGVDIEVLGDGTWPDDGNCGYVIVSNNHFVNMPCCLMITHHTGITNVHDIHVYSNLMENCGYANFAFDFPFYIEAGLPTSTTTDIYFDNNSVVGGTGNGMPWGGMFISNSGTMDGVYVRNNIFSSISQCPFVVQVGSVNNLTIVNNILFNTGNGDNLKNSGSLSNYVNSGNLKVDPLFASSVDFNLKPGSPAIDAGLNVGLPFYGKAPDIGAFETPDGELHLNQLPVVSISSPTKGSSYIFPATVTLDVEAYDPDGTISKVEILNGSIKLGERTTAPFSFTLKDLPEGSYSLKAVATDNLKSATTSSILEFQVSSYNENREFFNLYPNPNNGRFTINFTTALEVDKFTVTIVNLIGRTVYREELSTEEDNRQFDLSHLNPGTYVLMISSDEILLTQKFIKG